jgi:hypothetical protein
VGLNKLNSPGVSRYFRTAENKPVRTVPEYAGLHDPAMQTKGPATHSPEVGAGGTAILPHAGKSPAVDRPQYACNFSFA